jgi:hypothetical protein
MQLGELVEVSPDGLDCTTAEEEENASLRPGRMTLEAAARKAPAVGGAHLLLVKIAHSRGLSVSAHPGGPRALAAHAPLIFPLLCPAYST